jgi:hypothetical protein
MSVRDILNKYNQGSDRPSVASIMSKYGGHKTSPATLQAAQDNAAKLKAESDKLNSWSNLAYETLRPTNLANSMRQIGTQIKTHPIRTAEAFGAGVVDEGLRPIANLAANYNPIGMIASSLRGGKQINLPKTGFKPQNTAEEGIYGGGGFGGQAGAFMAGNALLKPILEAPTIVNAIGKYVPKAVETTMGATQRLRPLASELLSDQITTQAMVDPGSSLKDRGIQAATAPVLSLALHGLGRGTKKLTAPFKNAEGVVPNTDLSGLSTEEALKVMKSREIPTGARINPKTGEIETKAFVDQAIKAAGDQKAKPQNWLGKAWDVATSSTAARIEKMGAPGKALVNMMKQQQYLASVRKADWKPKIQEAFKGMDAEGRGRIQLALENPGAVSNLATTQEQVAFRLLDSIRKNVKEWADRSGLKSIDEQGKSIDWIGMDPDKYMPHYFSEKTQTSKEFKEGVIDRMLKNGEANNRWDAEVLFKQWSENNMTRRAGSLEYQRKYDMPDYEKDPEKVFQKYTDQVARRMSEIDMFGQTHEKLKPLLGKIAEMGYKVEDAQKLLDAMYSTKPHSKVIEKALQWNQFTKLSLSGFQNLTQSTNTLTQGGLGNTLKVMYQYIKSPASRESMMDVAKLADAFDEVIISSESGIQPGWLMNKALYVFKKTEKFNRFVAANVGKEHAKDLFKVLKSNPADATAIRGLEHLGIDVQALVERGKLDPEDLVKAAYNMVGSTQFRIDPLNLPLWTRTDAGKFFSQFQSFSFMQTKFYRDQIVREARQGNLLPLLRMMITAPPAYFAAKGVRNFIANKKPAATEEEKDKEFLDMAFNVTGTLPGSLLQKMNYTGDKLFGKGSEYATPLDKVATVAGNFLGPTVSDIGNTAKAMEQSGQIQKENLLERPENQIDAMYPLKKLTTGWIPYAGPAIKNTAYGEWPQRQREVFRDNLKAAVADAIKSGNREKLKEVMKTNPTQNGINVLQDVYREVMLEQMGPEKKARYDAIKKRKEELNYSPILK